MCMKCKCVCFCFVYVCVPVRLHSNESISITDGHRAPLCFLTGTGGYGQNECRGSKEKEAAVHRPQL